MFINDQYLFNQSFYWLYQRNMEQIYMDGRIWEADLLWTLMVGA